MLCVHAVGLAVGDDEFRIIALSILQNHVSIPWERKGYLQAAVVEHVKQQFYANLKKQLPEQSIGGTWFCFPRRTYDNNPEAEREQTLERRQEFQHRQRFNTERFNETQSPTSMHSEPEFSRSQRLDP